MATYGQATTGLPAWRGDESTFARISRFAAIGLVSASCVGLLAAGGCAAPTVRMGKPPAVHRLGELEAGVSTTKDVIAVLGEPQGRGATRSPSYGLKDAWLYESTEAEGTKARVRMLMIFLDKDTGVYQGHLWGGAGFLFGQIKE